MNLQEPSDPCSESSEPKRDFFQGPAMPCADFLSTFFKDTQVNILNL